jgi:hypothetical protein
MPYLRSDAGRALGPLRPGPQKESELLFPSEVGGYRSPSSLDKPFAAVAKAIELKKRITPRAMRRSFQDLCRTAEVKDVVARSICGHATEAMHLGKVVVGYAARR